ncbi:hypothetical protein C8J56DRAFT_1035356 [Mycena floridula]|nr:hypothetical protein C8J56DRAFT_1035356 [Mycena floridula]
MEASDSEHDLEVPEEQETGAEHIYYSKAKISHLKCCLDEMLEMAAAPGGVHPKMAKALETYLHRYRQLQLSQNQQFEREDQDPLNAPYQQPVKVCIHRASGLVLIHTGAHQEWNERVRHVDGFDEDVKSIIFGSETDESESSS